jgi:hypothetical protein
MIKNTKITWTDFSYENLLKTYPEYVKKIELDHEHIIVTNMLCLVNFTKPKLNWGNDKTREHTEYIKSNYKIITQPVLIKWDNEMNRADRNPGVRFYCRNVEPIKFAKVEDLGL